MFVEFNCHSNYNSLRDCSTPSGVTAAFLSSSCSAVLGLECLCEDIYNIIYIYMSCMGLITGIRTCRV